MSEDVKKCDSLEAAIEMYREYTGNLGEPADEVLRWMENNWAIEGSCTQMEGHDLADAIQNGPRPEDASNLMWWPNVKPNINAENYWIWRDMFRAFRGWYTAVPFANRLRNTGLTRYWWHFPHVSLTDRSMVAFTPSCEYGKRDRQVRMKVGKYLQRFYSDVFDEQAIREIANTCKPFVISWATTRDEMREIYSRGPSSCMSGSAYDFSCDGYHPVDVYEGEFRLAYIDSGGIVARGFVHEPTKRWVRTYGSEMLALQTMLNAEGYHQSDNGWVGAHLRAIEICGGNDWVMPYLDGGCQSVRLVTHDGKRMFEVVSNRSDYDGSASNTNGRLHNYDGDDEYHSNCDSCGDRYHNDDLHYIERHDVSVCEDCRDDEYTYAVVRIRNGRRYFDYVQNDDVVEFGRDYFLNDAELLAEVGAVRCQHCDELTGVDDMHSDEDGDLYCEDCVVWWTDDRGNATIMGKDRLSSTAGYDFYADWRLQISDNQIVGIVPPDAEHVTGSDEWELVMLTDYLPSHYDSMEDRLTVPLGRQVVNAGFILRRVAANLFSHWMATQAAA